jgi:actin-related protein 6
MYTSPACLVIDSGFSYTYGVPFFNGIPMKNASLRIDVGGKLLTNYLTETISHKDFNLKNEFGIVNDMKEKTSFLSESPKNFNYNMELCKRKINPIKKEYILPDYKTIKKGYVRSQDDEIK